ncbi:threonine/serine exporter family protein [Dokdonella sp.]|uniref:threonine/serine ThrE exporter family protein n=1 Tax=Dokdonella sp. TaxID=2291710 RepID=UPI0025BD0A61|nr:threonine/serine exporter family protein [Dokdonella sp.]MBX3689472.1 threonine/serine exporter family protein [Dokdonella sp.]
MPAAHPSQVPDSVYPLKTRIGFIVELSRRLHEYGTTAPRLEDVVNLASARLGLACNVLSTPTSIVMSFSERAASDDLADFTQVVRVPPGEVNLARLCQVDDIADRVIAGQLDLAEGRRRLREIGARRSSRLTQTATVVAFGVASAAVAAILHTGWVEVAVAFLNGILIGALALLPARWPSFANAFEAVAAFVSTLTSILVASFIMPLELRPVVIASIIVLVPGMTLTTAVRELSSQHLVSGSARMMGAMATLLKLLFGSVAALQGCALVHLVPPLANTAAIPIWAEWVAIFAGAMSFAVLFKTPLRFAPLVVAAPLLGYVCTQMGGSHVSPVFGTFLGALVVGAASNLFARYANRPGALIREPGIILLVPGSVGFRSLSYVLERNVQLGVDTAITMTALLIAIVAGLFFGDLLIPPRRKL